MDVLLKYTKKLIRKAKEYMSDARRSMIISAKDELLIAYWRIGKKINEYEEDEKNLIFYEDDLFENISDILEIDLGKIFSASNLKFSKKEIRKSNLTWSHYKELLLIEDNNEMKFYNYNAIKQKWSVSELHLQIENDLYHKMLPKTLNLTY